MKQICRQQMKVAEMVEFVCKRVENNVGKEENPCYLFLLSLFLKGLLLLYKKTFGSRVLVQFLGLYPGHARCPRACSLSQKILKIRCSVVHSEAFFKGFNTLFLAANSCFLS